ncbi:rod shape-determining protein MreC [Metabacillus litoralis]|uniref:rod shape-determining protein MreC n=1 Tax=Metabacillus litoralis TaxID=152268 RepID=UPI001CFE740C|nr:rod shape-determining protein MreC [Metabacillus litoralis]
MNKKLLILIILIIILAGISIKFSGVYHLKETIRNNEFLSQIKDIWFTYKENQLLKNRIDGYEQAKIEKEIIIADTEILNEIKTLVNKYKSHNPVIGTVIKREIDPNNPQVWYNSLIIDKGKNDSIKKNMAVLGPDGLVGIIHKVNDTTSEVQLLTNTGRKGLIPATLKKDKSVFGMIEKYNLEKNQLHFTRIDTEIELEIGSIVMTSELSITLPRELEIGKIIEVKNDNFGLTKTAVVEPSSDFTDIKYVVILQ